MKTIIALLLFIAPVAALAQQKTLDYQFDAVKRKVTLNDNLRVDKGQHAKSGDEVETGWFSYALIASPSSRAKFEIFSGTSVRLADGTAGVLLSVERGRIRAAFDKIIGSEPRVVKTPGALLAVRGTKFDVEVDPYGDTIVDVFEGVVEVQSPLRAESMFVRAGEQTLFGRRREPSVRPMPDDRRDRGPDHSPDLNRPDHDRDHDRDHSGHDAPPPSAPPSGAPSHPPSDRRPPKP
jgi:hypothetical protein